MFCASVPSNIKTKIQKTAIIWGIGWPAPQELRVIVPGSLMLDHHPWDRLHIQLQPR